MPKADVSKTVLAPYLHREFGLVEIDLLVGKNTRQIVEWGQSNRTLCAEKQGVVLGVTVGSGDQPIEGHGIQKALHVVFRMTGMLPQQIDDLTNSRPAVTLIFAGGMEGKRLTHILLVHAKPLA